jgi:hypothetical protein
MTKAKDYDVFVCRLWTIPASRTSDGRLKWWAGIYPLYSGKVVGFAVHIGRWDFGISKRKWWK